MRPTFEIVARDGAGRLGRFKTAHGVVTTPTLLPVINPNLRLIEASAMRAMGAEMVITNSYIIRKKEALRERALAEGVRSVIGWDGPVMTDSGTFQTYVYGDGLDIDPREIVRFQRDIGVDVGTILDIFSTPDRTHAEAADDVARTVVRAREATADKGDAMALACTVQGSVYPDLRAACARAYRDDASIGADFHPIGGVVPLMEQQRYATLVDAIVAAKMNLDPSRPVHLFGAGHPLVFPFAALLGCDFFDSASYAKYAKDGRMIFEDGTRHLADLEEIPCACAVCSRYSAAELKKAPEAERTALLAEHNLRVSFAEVRRVRQAIRAGDLWELVEMRARAHPALLDALKAIARHADWLETLEPVSKRSAFFYAGPESVARPDARRARERLLSRWDPRGRTVVVMPPGAKPASMTYAPILARLDLARCAPAVRSMFGLVPFELDEAYPFAQSVEPRDPDREAFDTLAAFETEFAKRHGVAIVEAEAAGDGFDGPASADFDLLRVRAVADHQFGPGAGLALLDGNAEVGKSRRTDKIRTVHVDGEHVLSMRAEDGHFTLKLAGAKRLHAALPAPRLRVVVHDDSVPFNRDGKSAFAKFVLACDPALRAGDECLVVDGADNLVGCGQLTLAPSEIPYFRSGPAVHVREGLRIPGPP
ncbi:MAG TPA: tRNA guanosine(15) transglycosylase TgtA [Candidatus Thermoplasmatota archaeon]|nr:tRNA guanosine(15) transglycosylase TgtA [Candidatus Thermoplasmatota archaeon]